MNEPSKSALSYAQLVDLAQRGQALHHWRAAYPYHENGLGLRILRLRWEFLSVPELEADQNLQAVIQEILERGRL